MFRFFKGAMPAVFFLLSIGLAHAELNIGDKAPDFALPDQFGRMHHLADYRGKTVVLAFYPKDFTLG